MELLRSLSFKLCSSRSAAVEKFKLKLFPRGTTYELYIDTKINNFKFDSYLKFKLNFLVA
jgi:hypothetical protein